MRRTRHESKLVNSGTPGDPATGRQVASRLYEKPVGWINASAQAAADGAHHTLRVVLDYVNADVVEDACVKIPVRRDAVGPDGLIIDPEVTRAIAAVLAALVNHVESKSAVMQRG